MSSADEADLALQLQQQREEDLPLVARGVLVV